MWLLHLSSFKFELYFHQRSHVGHTALFDKLLSVEWLSPGTSLSFTNKTDRRDVTEISLKVTLFLTQIIYFIYVVSHVHNYIKL